MSIAPEITRSGRWGSRKAKKIAALVIGGVLCPMVLTHATTAQQGCELLASRPTLITPLRMFGEGGRQCSGPSNAEQIRVRLRHDRTIWFDKTLAQANGTATGTNFELGVSYACSHFERKKVYVETKNLTTGKRVESPRNTLHCVGPG